MDKFLIMITYAFSGLLMMGVSIPLIQRKVRPNPWYGMRTRKTLSHPDIWYPANEYCGVMLLIAGGLMAASAVLLLFIPFLSVDKYAVLTLVVTIIVLVWAMYNSFRFLKKMPESK